MHLERQAECATRSVAYTAKSWEVLNRFLPSKILRSTVSEPFQQTQPNELVPMCQRWNRLTGHWVRHLGRIGFWHLTRFQKRYDTSMIFDRLQHIQTVAQLLLIFCKPPCRMTMLTVTVCGYELLFSTKTNMCSLSDELMSTRVIPPAARDAITRDFVSAARWWRTLLLLMLQWWATTSIKFSLKKLKLKYNWIFT